MTMLRARHTRGIVGRLEIWSPVVCGRLCSHCCLNSTWVRYLSLWWGRQSSYSRR
jgi:hypothetical protein